LMTSRVTGCARPQSGRSKAAATAAASSILTWPGFAMMRLLGVPALIRFSRS
jgi:hypothetical protein